MPRRRGPPHPPAEAGEDAGRVLPNRGRLQQLREQKRQELRAKNVTAVKDEFLRWLRTSTFPRASEDSESGRGIWDSAFGRKPSKMYRASLGKLAAFFRVPVEELMDARGLAPSPGTQPPGEPPVLGHGALELSRALERWRQQVMTQPKWQPVRLILSAPATGGLELYQEPSVRILNERESLLSAHPSALAEYARALSTEEALSAISLTALLTLDERRSVLMGVPGSGKTAASKWILHLVEAGLITDYRCALFVSLREYALALRARPSLGILVHFFTHALGVSLEEGQALAAVISGQQEEQGGPVPLVLLDGWDEVPPDMKEPILGAMERELSAFRVLVTSRPSGGPRALASGATGFYDLYPLTAPAVRRFVHRFCHIKGQREAAPRLLSEITRDAGLHQLSLTPFLLMIVCEVLLVHEHLPVEAPLTHAWIMNQLLVLVRQEHNDRHPGMRLDVRATEKLSAFAYTLSLASGAKRVAGPAPASIRDDENVLASRFLNELNNEPGTFEFAHLRLQEFLAALALRDRPEEEQGRFIRECGLTAQWAEETAFLAGLSREKGPEQEPWRSMRGHLSAAAEELTGNAWQRVGRVVAAAALSEGGAHHLGEDLRGRLLRFFLEGRALTDDFLSTLLRLDGDYVIRQWLQEPDVSEALWSTVYRLAPVDLRQRSGLEAWIGQHPSLSYLRGMKSFRLLDEGTLAQLRKTVSDTSAQESERSEAIRALGHAADTDAIELLEPFVMQPTALTRRAAAALANIGGPSAARVLVKALLSEQISADPKAAKWVSDGLMIGRGGALEPASRDLLIGWVAQHWRSRPPALPHVLAALLRARLPMGGGLILDLLKHEELEPELRSSALSLLKGVTQESVLEAAGAYALGAHDEGFRRKVFDSLPFVPPNGEVARALIAQVDATSDAEDTRLEPLLLLARARARFPNSPLLRHVPGLMAASLRTAYEDGRSGAIRALWHTAALHGTEELNALAWETAQRSSAAIEDRTAPMDYLRASRVPPRVREVSGLVEQLLKAPPPVVPSLLSRASCLLAAKIPALLPWLIQTLTAAMETLPEGLADAIIGEALTEAARNGWLVFPGHVVSPTGQIEYPPAW